MNLDVKAVVVFLGEQKRKVKIYHVQDVGQKMLSGYFLRLQQ